MGFYARNWNEKLYCFIFVQIVIICSRRYFFGRFLNIEGILMIFVLGFKMSLICFNFTEVRKHAHNYYSATMAAIVSSTTVVNIEV